MSEPGALERRLDGELSQELRHRLRPMGGRATRATMPLELLYDLTYVIAFATAAELLAHHIIEGAPGPAVIAYLFATFSVTWAWLNFTWFASAYANDDALFRVATIVQMVGAVIMVFGLPASFAATVEGASPLSPLVIAGYIVMRVPLVLLWLRAAHHDAPHRTTARAYAAVIALAQLAWIAIALIPQTLAGAAIGFAVLAMAEMTAPVLIERRWGRAPWDASQLADRFGLLTLVTLGEVIAATTVAVGALVGEADWSPGAITVAAAGIVLAASLWWAYYLIPSGVILPRWPGRVFRWRYAHLPLFGAITAIGAGLRVAAEEVGEESMSLLGIALCLAIPVAAVLATIFVMWSLLLRAYDLAHVPLFLLALSPVAAGVVVAATAGPEPLDLDHPGSLALLVVVVGLVSLGAVVEVVGHEIVGYRHTARAVARAIARGDLPAGGPGAPGGPESSSAQSSSAQSSSAQSSSSSV
jgi:low temperature requirement protein LtrA